MSEKKNTKIGMGEFAVILLVIIIALVIITGIVIIKKNAESEITSGEEKIASLEKQIETIKEQEKQKTEVSKNTNNDITQNQTKNNSNLTIDEAYKIFEEKYNMVIEMSTTSSIKGFEFKDTDIAGRSEIINFEEFMNKNFTQNGIKKAKDLMGIIEENGKYYIDAHDGVLGKAYITTEFIKSEVTENILSCYADSLYINESSINDINNNGDWVIGNLNDIEHKTYKFVIKLDNGIWKIDTFSSVQGN